MEQPHQSGTFCSQVPVQRASGHLMPTMGISTGFLSQTPSAQVMVLQQTSLVSGPCHLLTFRKSRSCEYVWEMAVLVLGPLGWCT